MNTVNILEQASTCALAAVDHGSALLVQSQLEAFSAASVLVQMALLLLLLLSPVMPCAVYALQRDCSAKPLHPNSTGMHLAFQPFRLPGCHTSLSSTQRLPPYTVHGTVTSNMTMFFVASDTRKISGLGVVFATCWGNLSLLPRYSDSCQSCAVLRSPGVALGASSWL